MVSRLLSRGVKIIWGIGGDEEGGSLVSGRVVHCGALLDGEDDLGRAVGTSSSEVKGILSAEVDTSIAAKRVKRREGRSI